MSVSTKIKTYLEWREQAAWRLLAADQGPLIVGILQSVLYDNETVLPSSVFHHRIAQALDHLNEEGFSLPQPAQAYIAHWLSSGYLSRTFPPDASEEVYELTTATVQVIRFIDRFDNKRQFATESRLNLVIQQLNTLAEQTDGDIKNRLTVLKKERQQIDEEIKALKKGQITTLADDRAVERLQEIVGLSEELVNDFREVKERFYTLNRQFREQLMEIGESRGAVLEKIFSDVDVIAESEAGKSFTAFWRLLTDPVQGMMLESATEQLLSRSFMGKLSTQSRCFLAQLTCNLLQQGGAVHEVLQYFARSLKHYVQSREFREQRQLMVMLQETQHTALALKSHVSMKQVVLPKRYLTSARIRSLAQCCLYDPRLHLTHTTLVQGEAAMLSLATVKSWIAQSEIDFRCLKRHIVALLNHEESVSIADILTHYPAEQGLGTIIGYLALGTRYGVLMENSDEVSWEQRDGRKRRAMIPKIYFTKDSFCEFIHE